MRTASLLFLLAGTLSLAACSLFGDDSARQLGVISTDADADDSFVEAWEAPNGVATGEARPAPWQQFGPWWRYPVDGGYILGHYDGPPLIYPGTVQADAPFTVTIITTGGTSCWMPDSEEVSVSGDRLEVTVYDRHVGGRGTACPDVFQWLMRDLTFTLDEPGEYELAVTGRRVYEGNWHDGGEPYTVRGVIVVE